MVKDYYPISIEKIHKEIQDEYKINELIHDNFCIYKYNKGKNKGKLCLNRFKDINDLKFCHTHRYEKKPWLTCNTLGCNEKTKLNICKVCKKMYNIPLPNITNDEIMELSDDYVPKEIIKIIIPNAKYRIVNYYLHNEYKKYTININFAILKKSKVIKNIKDDEYCKYLRKRKFKKVLKNDIELYLNYINKLKNKFTNILNIIIKLKRIRKRYVSFEDICNTPLPQVSQDEELLLNLDINNLLKKKKSELSDVNKNNNENILNSKRDSDGIVLELNISENYKEQINKKCNKCSKYDLLINNLYNINKKIGKEIINVQPDFGNVYLDHKILSKILDKNKDNNIKKEYFDLKRFIKYFEGFKVHLIELNFKNIEKLTPKPFNKHKKFIEIFINNISNLLKEEKYVQYKYDIKKMIMIPNPLI